LAVKDTCPPPPELPDYVTIAAKIPDADATDFEQRVEDAIERLADLDAGSSLREGPLARRVLARATRMDGRNPPPGKARGKPRRTVNRHGVASTDETPGKMLAPGVDRRHADASRCRRGAG
jgi:hypothetical protein